MEHVKELFEKTYPDLTPRFLKSYGRLEIIGNHTDHNHGLCLVAGASMGIQGAFSASGDDLIEVRSEGYPPFRLKVGDFEKKPDEVAKSQGLLRGVMNGLSKRGYQIGGFRACLTSTIFPGAGVSSSACFESLAVKIFSLLFNDDKVTPLEMAKIGQEAEREYFGKPCGLLDQIGTSFGDICFLDFKDIDNPIVEPIHWNLPLSIVLVNSGGSHSKLTSYYAAIPERMKKVAEECGAHYLRDLPEDVFRSHHFPEGFDSHALLTAEHFYEENDRVSKAKKAIQENDVFSFLEAVEDSGDSSRDKLKNTLVPGQYEGSPQQAVDRARRILPFGKGTARIMGGGFAGSILCFVPEEIESRFLSSMRNEYGERAVVKISIVPNGPSEVFL